MSTNEETLVAIQQMARDLKRKIADLQKETENLSEPEKSKQLELIAEMKQKETIIQHYVKLLEFPEGQNPKTTAEQLKRMMKDIDATYREALAYTF